MTTLAAPTRARDVDRTRAEVNFDEMQRVLLLLLKGVLSLTHRETQAMRSLYVINRNTYETALHMKVSCDAVRLYKHRALKKLSKALQLDEG